MSSFRLGDPWLDTLHLFPGYTFIVVGGYDTQSFVKTSEGRTFIVHYTDYTDGMSVLAVKLVIVDKEGTPPSQQCLMYSGRERHSFDQVAGISTFQK